MQKVALVTGGARRIGAAIVEHLHHAGFCVAIHCHNSGKEARALSQKLNRKIPNSTIVLESNLLDPNAWGHLITEAAKTWGRLDALIHNASLFFKTPIDAADLTQWDTLFTCNVKAPFFLSQAARPFLQVTQGSIVNITDFHAQKAFKTYAIYGMSKAALHYQTRILAKEFAPSIRVNAVAPGMIGSPLPPNTLNKALKTQILSQIALKREGTYQEIAEAVCFLLNHAYITGKVIEVDGGRDL